MNLTHLCLCLILLAPMVLGAQVPAVRAEEAGRAALAADSVPQSILAAELIGARRSSPPANNPAASVSGQPDGGLVERKCVDVSGTSVARSGDFVAGPFDLYASVWRTGYGKIWWQPRHVSGPGVAPLVVRAKRLDANDVDRVYEITDIAHNLNPRTCDLSSTSFYPSGIHLPGTGEWLLLATAGENWGCFVLTFE